MANYSVSGKCYSLPSDALAAWIAAAPSYNKDYIYNFTGVPTISSTGLITATPYLTLVSFGTAPAAGVSRAFQLSTCTNADIPYDYTGGSAIFGFFFIFVLSLYLVSKSAGAIINAVRRL